MTLGVIVRPHGLKGEVKVHLTCSGVERLKNCPSLRLVKDGLEIKKVSVQRAFLHSDGDAIIRFREIEGVQEAEGLRGVELAILPQERAPLAEGDYYLDDLEGLKVSTVDGQYLGVVEEVLEMPATWVCVVRKDGEERLVPFSKVFVRELDLKAGRMTVDLPEEIDGDSAD